MVHRGRQHSRIGVRIRFGVPIAVDFGGHGGERNHARLGQDDGCERQEGESEGAAEVRFEVCCSVWFAGYEGDYQAGREDEDGGL